MTYIVRISQHGRVVKEERVGSGDMARQLAEEWRARGYQVVVTNDNNASLPY
jgi:hypothetical protein